MISIVSALGQIFYAWRIWVLTKRIWIPVIILALALVQSGAGMWSGVWAHQIGHFSEIQMVTYKVTSVWLAGTALCNFIIAASMTYTLLTSRSGMRSTNAVIVRIVRLVIETGTVCALFAILDLIFYLRFPHKTYHLILTTALSKLYSNSLFAVLNSRIRILGSRTGDTTDFDPSLATTLQFGADADTMNLGERRTDTATCDLSVNTPTNECHDDENNIGLGSTKYADAYKHHEHDTF